jgi:flagellar biosynthesis/type III secretory pathway protein FliH
MMTTEAQTYQAEYLDGYQQGYVQGYRQGYEQGLEEGMTRTMRSGTKTMRGWIRTQLARYMCQAKPLTREVVAAILAQYGLMHPSGPPASPIVSMHDHNPRC